ncbi:putative membrane protein [Candidatus Rhodobacter oscarellae]|uniref:Putative membrane protein n=1 Tax=Candidatus Rhodobacter oscarellae TaxID=1675527 RepID=A0A0J9E4L4_9RHOB|nr:DMT family transporter [Candidatus Rhodobacter lobularis]KMW57730.1 putative membrane protein [Candidatus Rhodobacter lobularis]
MTAMDRPGLGIGLRVLSGVLMASMLVCVKAVSADVPLGEIVFFRSAFAVIPLILFLWLRGEFPQGLATKRPMGHLLRASFGALALFASFAAIARLNLAEAILIAQLSPILMAIAAVALLGERLTVWRVGGLALGFAGVVVMVWPELGADGASGMRFAGLLLGLLSAALTALALIMVRSLNRTESPGAIALYFVLASMLGALATLPWGWVMPSSGTLLLLVFAGLFGGFAHIAMTLAFRYAEATRLAPFEYIALLWPILADLLIFRLSLSTSFLLALPLIMLGAFTAAAEKTRSPTRPA